MPTYTHVIEFDEAELICRMVEAFVQQPRPGDKKATAIVDNMPDELRSAWLRVSEVVQVYIAEAVSKAKRLQ